MQTAEEFFREYLCEKGENFDVSSKLQAKLRRKYFGNDLQRCHTEFEKIMHENPPLILSVDSVGDSAKIVTFEKYRKAEMRYRHILQFTNGSWTIEQVQMECLFCKGTGQSNDEVCKHCKGIGWKDFMN